MRLRDGDRRHAGDDQPRPLLVRAAVALTAVLLTFLVIFIVGFGTKTSCTSSPPTNSPGCDQIDRWAWGGLLAVVAVAVVGALVSRRRGGMTVTLAFIACVVVVTCVGMYAVSP